MVPFLDLCGPRSFGDGLRRYDEGSMHLEVVEET